MKKLISLLLATSLVLSLGAFSVSAEDVKLDKTGWTVEASSEHQNSAQKAIDGNVKSYWHSYFSAEGTTIVNKAASPHELKITLPESTVISGFSYVPRTGESSTGRVLKYEFYGADLSDNMTLIASGEFANDETEKVIKFQYNVEVKSVLFKMTETVAVSGVVAELDLFAEDSSLSKKALSEISSITISSNVNKTEVKKEESAKDESFYEDKASWKAEASSVFANYTAAKAIDGTRDTYWHTFYEVVEGKAGNKTPPPYDLTIDLGGEHVISGFSYVPRTGESTTGRVTKYEIYGSDGSDNYVLIGSGEFPNSEDAKTVKLKNNIPVNKIKYKILGVVGGCGVVAEFDLVKEDASLPKVALSSVTAESFITEAPKTEEKPKEEKPAATTNGAKKVEGEVPVDPRYVDKNGWTAYAEHSFPSGGETVEKSIDGNPDTYWHSYFKAVDGVNQKASMPYDVIYTLPSLTTVSGFCYLPRQSSGSTSGRVLGYELYASADDSENWIKLAEGKFPNDGGTKDVHFVCNVDVKKIMFRVTAGLNGYAVIGEFDLMVKREGVDTVSLSDYGAYSEDNAVNYIDVDGIVAEASSEWTGRPAMDAFDGRLESFWHKDPDDKGMMLLKVDLGREYEVAGFTYYPRRDDVKGHWKKFNMYASTDDNEYIAVLSGATFDTIDYTSKDVRFTEPVKMRYIEFEIDEYHGHCAAAEIGFYQTSGIAKEEKATEKYVLRIDNPVIKSEINGVTKETTLDVSPFIKNSNTMIPLRGLLEEMGASIEWNGENQSITVKKGLITIDMQIKRRQVYVTKGKNTVRYAFRTSPIIKDSRTFIPLRFISENLGYNVAWDGETRTITITTPEEE